MQYVSVSELVPAAGVAEDTSTLEQFALSTISTVWLLRPLGNESWYDEHIFPVHWHFVT